MEQHSEVKKQGGSLSQFMNFGKKLKWKYFLCSMQRNTQDQRKFCGMLDTVRAVETQVSIVVSMQRKH
jgi:hypothetical protein